MGARTGHSARATCFSSSRLRQSDMLDRQIGPERHVPGQPAPPERHVGPAGRARATCWAVRSGQSDMFPVSRLRQSDMLGRQIGPERHVPVSRLCQSDMLDRRFGPERHVPGQPTPPERRVGPAGRARATCSRSADSARATCWAVRSGQSDMFPVSRLRQSDMLGRQIGLERHVLVQPTSLERHVPTVKRHPDLRGWETPTFAHLGDANLYAREVLDHAATRAPLRRASPDAPPVLR